MRSARNWPKDSYGAWVLSEVVTYLKLKTEIDPYEILDTPSEIWGGLNAPEFVLKLVRGDKAQSFADAWHEVLGQMKRVYG